MKKLLCSYRQIIVFATTILSVLIIYSSCKKGEVQKNIKSTSYFPNSIGDYWEYDVYDSSAVMAHPNSPRNYKVTVTIERTINLLDGVDANVWKYEYPWGNDSMFVRLVNDTIKVFDPITAIIPTGLNFPVRIFVFPFFNEKRWDGKLTLIDSFHAYNVASVTTNSETFEDCFNIYHYYYGPDTEFKDNYFFKANVGMIKIHLNQFYNAPFEKYLWTLKKYVLH